MCYGRTKLRWDKSGKIVSEPSFPYGQEYISLLARQGKIDAFKEGKNWLTKKSAIKNYMDTRSRKSRSKVLTIGEDYLE